MREYTQMVDRPVKIRRYPRKGRSLCPRKNYTFACNVRFGLFCIKEDRENGEDTLEEVKYVDGWGLCNFLPHSCKMPQKESDRPTYPSKLSAVILLRETKNVGTIAYPTARRILKPYFRRALGRKYIARTVQ